MRKNKTLAFALAASLLVGGTFVGTKALFQDQSQYTGELKISTGDLDIEIVNNGTWARVKDSDDAIDGQNGIDFDNLKTNDILRKEIKIQNLGTLDANVTLNKNTGVIDNLPEGIEYTAKFKDEKGTITDITSGNEVLKLNANSDSDEATIILEIEVKGGGQHIKKQQTETPASEESTYSLNSDSQEETTINLSESYILNAVQTQENK